MEKDKKAHLCRGKGSWIAGRIARGIVIGLLFALVFGLVVKLLWNWLAPAVFNLHAVTYLQAVGMIVLARLLFGIRGMRPGCGRWHGRNHWAHGGGCGGADANDRIKDWRYYDAWWEAEGREAFRRYCEGRKE